MQPLGEQSAKSFSGKDDLSISISSNCGIAFTQFPTSSKRMSKKIDLSEYTIRLASPEQDVEQLKACFIPWGRGRTWDVSAQTRLSRYRMLKMI